MSIPKSKKNLLQVTIFEWLSEQQKSPQTPAPGSLDMYSELCAAISDDLKTATDDQGKSLTRYDVAARMSNLLNREITKSMLDDWAAPSHDKSMPRAHEMAAFVRATGGQRRAMEIIARHAGLFTVPGPDALRAQIQRAKEVMAEAKRDIAKCEALLREVER